MAQTSGSGGLGPLAMGGIAAAVVIVGGVVLVQLGVFGTDAPQDAAALRSESQTEVTISPSAGRPVVIPSTGAANDNEAAPVVPQESVADPAATSEVETVQQAAEDGSEQTVPPEPESAISGAPVEQPVVADQSGQSSEANTTSEAAATADEEAEAHSDVPAAAETAQAEEPAVDQPASELPPLEAPRLDLVRVDPDGAMVIAGRAQAGSLVVVMLDETALEETQVDGSGEFAVFASIVPSDRPRVVSLLARLGAQEAASQDQFILAPAAPVSPPQVAEAPVPQPEAGDTVVAAVTAVEASDTGPEKQPEEAQIDVREPAKPAEAAPALETETADAQVPAPPVEAEVNAPAEPAAEPNEQTGVETAAAASSADVADTVETTPPPPSQQPAQSEASADAETQSAPRPASTAVAVLRAGADGVELVQPAAPVISGKVALDTISYSDDGAVLLAGRGRAGALVRVYVDNRLSADFPVAEDSRWGGRVDTVEPGIYTLRLDEVAVETGAVLSRLETPFKREAPEVLQPPAQQPGAAPDQPVPLVRAVTVQEGDTLWAISQARYGSGFLYVRVFEANQDAIRNPDLIYPGQVFNLPE